jgi:quercetin dioxygenase-like cupin family protein
MDVIRYENAERYEPQKDWVRSSLCNKPDISIEHFIKPPKHSSPTHSHPNSQVLYVLQGEIIVKTNDDEQRLEKGDTVYIPGEQTHTVINPLNEVSIGIDIFIPGRSFDFWLSKNK